jgi:hypothetical protein
MATAALWRSTGVIFDLIFRTRTPRVESLAGVQAVKVWLPARQLAYTALAEDGRMEILARMGNDADSGAGP